MSDAEPLFQRAVLIAKKTLDLREKSLGRDHIDVAVALHDLAELFRKHGELAELVLDARSSSIGAPDDQAHMIDD